MIWKLPLFVKIYFGFCFFYLLWFWTHAFQFSDQGVMSGHENIWADGAAHLTMISGFGYQSLFPSQSPFLAGYPYSYPFVINWLSGLLVRFGLSIFVSFALVSFVVNLSSLVALFFLANKVLKSKKVAVFASIIYLSNGGIGFFYYLQNVWHSNDKLESLINPFRYVTHIPEWHLHYINLVHSMFMTQRSFSLGLFSGLIILILVIELIEKKWLTNFKLLTLILLIGILPIIHTHTFLSLFFLISVLIGINLLPFLWQQRTKKLGKKLFFQLILITIFSGGLSITMTKLFLSDNVSSSFIRFLPGWYAAEDGVNWFYFWWLNWGITPLVWLVATFKLIKEKNEQILLSFSLGGLLIFMLVNLVIWQPNIFDNTKLLAWSSLTSSLSIAWLLGQNWQKNQLKKIAVVLIFFLIICSGLIEIYRVARIDLHSHLMYSTEELALVKWTINNTDSSSTWLTSDQHNHWLNSLSGRKHLMAYRGWLWTHGYDYKAVEADMSVMFAQPQSASDLFDKYQIKYIVIGPHEKREWQIDPRELNKIAKLIKQTENYQIFQLITTSDQ